MTGASVLRLGTLLFPGGGWRQKMRIERPKHDGADAIRTLVSELNH